MAFSAELRLLRPLILANIKLLTSFTNDLPNEARCNVSSPQYGWTSAKTTTGKQTTRYLQPVTKMSRRDVVVKEEEVKTSWKEGRTDK
ncbi:hypothetical protein EVAR_71690_1 [Eumeta japonica]|uniref:Uncharacterized protein n=1 Tax=Eumeta variegata TaxID=151549 RepID=A0A4C1S9A2_EUMVA|nr:hypothetical protein EVAR_71690_1 [Eumeta japonica]